MSDFPAPPVRTPFPDAKQWQPSGVPSWGWLKWFQTITDKFNLLFGSPPVITGSRGGNVALANLLHQLDVKGYVKDSTTP